ncbi:hypothetical protein [Lentibacillus sp. CBA3610]|uniref:hypothetical protein n=1 Tax=Lentibacillus sp. CBA3610 TaxID=2518176 RepID=UPI001595C937|nr:hypothetical protein [Lentibacillus sp. CBA3610]
MATTHAYLMVQVKANASKHKAMEFYEALTKKIDSPTNDMEALYDVIKPYIDEWSRCRTIS